MILGIWSAVSLFQYISYIFFTAFNACLSVISSNSSDTCIALSFPATTYPLALLAVTMGLEPTTSDVTDQRSTLLNYATILNLVFKVRHLPLIFSGTFALPYNVATFL